MADLRINWLVQVKDQATKALKKIQEATNSLRGRMGAAALSVKNFAASIGKGLWGLVTGFTARIVALGAAFLGLRAIKGAIDDYRAFGNAIREVQTLLPPAQASNEELKKTIQDLSAQFGTDTVENAKALYQTISAGFTDSADAAKILETANKLAVGGVTSTEIAVGGLTAILKSYNLSVSEADKVSDILFTTMKNARTTIGELSSEFAKVSAFGSQLGISVEELSAALGTMTLDGTSTAEAATALRGVLAAILKPTAEARKEAQRLGFEFSTAALRAKGLGGFLTELAEKTNNSEESSAKLFGNVRALSGILKITSNDMAAFNKILSDNQNALGATDEAMKKMTEGNLDFMLRQLSQEVNILKDGIASALVPSIIEAVKRVRGFVSILMNVDFKPIVSSLLSFGSTTINVFKVAGQAAFEFAKGIQRIPSLINVIGSALYKLLGGFAALSAKIAETFNFSKAAEGLNELSSFFVSTSDISQAAIMDTERSIMSQEAALEALAVAFEASGNVGVQSQKKIQTALKETQELAAVPMPEIEVAIKQTGFFEGLLDAAREMAAIVHEGIKSASGYLESKGVDTSPTGLAVAGTDIVGSLKKGSHAFAAEAAGAIGTALGGPIIGDLAKQITEVFGSAPEIFRKMIVDTIAGLGDILVNIIENIVNLPNILVEGLMKLVENLPSLVSRLIDSLIELLGSEKFMNSLLALTEQLAESLPAVIDTLVQRAPEIINAMVFQAPRIILAIIRMIPNLIKAFMFLPIQLVTGLISQIPSIIQSFISEIPKISMAIIQELPMIAKSLVDGILGMLPGGGGDLISDPIGSIGGFLGFEHGGIIKKLQKAQDGAIIGGRYEMGDRTLVRANRGEMILNSEQQQNLFDMISSGSGAPQSIVVNLQVGKEKLAETILSLKKDGYRIA